MLSLSKMVKLVIKPCYNLYIHFKIYFKNLYVKSLHLYIEINFVCFFKELNMFLDP